MIVLVKRGIVAFLFLLSACLPPIAPDEPRSLQTRYETLAPGVVLITSDREMGTGFFTDINGTLVTAAHVLFDRTFSIGKAGAVEVHLTAKEHLKVHLQDGSEYFLQVDPSAPNTIRQAAFDLAVVKKSVPVLTPQYLNLVQDGDLPKVGANVIAIGYPSGSEGKQSLYEGLISSIYVSHMAQGITNDTPERPVYRTRPFIQIEMPITGGVSGGPLITDSDQVIGVVDEVPFTMNRDIQALAQAYVPSIPLSVQPLSQTPLAALAWSVRNFLTPGLALVAPVRDLTSGSNGLAASPRQEEIESPTPTGLPH